MLCLLDDKQKTDTKDREEEERERKKKFLQGRQLPVTALTSLWAGCTCVVISGVIEACNDCIIISL